MSEFAQYQNRLFTDIKNLLDFLNKEEISPQHVISILSVEGVYRLIYFWPAGKRYKT